MDFLKNFENKNLIIWGAGNSFLQQQSFLKNRNIVFFVDNDSHKYNLLFEGKQVHPPEILKNISFNETKIIIASHAYLEIRDFLIQTFHLAENHDFISSTLFLYKNYIKKLSGNIS